MTNGSFYIMCNNNSKKNIVKIGFQSTQQVNKIITRYATACGSDITVFMFRSNNYKQMELDFKHIFDLHRVEREFYDGAYLSAYNKWCIDYTKAIPEIGDGRLNDLKRTLVKKEPHKLFERKRATRPTLNRLARLMKSL